MFLTNTGYRILEDLRKSFEEFENIFDSYNSNKNNQNNVKYNLYEMDNNEYVLELMVPGFKRENMEITLEGNYLRIKGEKNNAENNTKQRKPLVEEFKMNSFEKLFKVSKDVQIKQAELADGILKIYLGVETIGKVKINIS